MKRATYALIATALIAAVIWWWSGSGGADPKSARNTVADAPAASPGESRQAHPLPAHSSSKIEPDPSAEYAIPDVRAQFWISKDYWALAEHIHEAAKGGDGAAQYYLSVALNTCEFLYDYYFIEKRSGAPPRIRTLDEAKQLTATRQGSGYTPDDVQVLQLQCQRLMSTSPPPFGIAAEWMDAALASGYPLAQANAALSKALQARNSRDPETSRVARAEARALAVDALRSRDADVVLAISSPAAALAPDEPGEARKSQWTWVMAAYQRDPNSYSLLEWTKEWCRHDIQCHPDDRVIDILRRGAGNDLSEAERRARELNEKLDAGTFDESGI